jgi:hypothetical protein
MTACYGLPDHLIGPVAHAVRTAFASSLGTDPDGIEEFDGRPLHTLKALWWVRVDNEIHADLLSPEYARELLRVVQDGIEVNAGWLKDVSTVCFDPSFPSYLDLDLRSEEILMTLTEIARSASVAA